MFYSSNDKCGEDSKLRGHVRKNLRTQNLYLISTCLLLPTTTTTTTTTTVIIILLLIIIIVAAQDQEVSTNYFKNKILKEEIESKCRLYKQHEETIDHLT